MTREPDPGGGVTAPQAALMRLAFGAQAAQVVYAPGATLKRAGAVPLVRGVRDFA